MDRLLIVSQTYDRRNYPVSWDCLQLRRRGYEASVGCIRNSRQPSGGWEELAVGAVGLDQGGRRRRLECRKFAERSTSRENVNEWASVALQSRTTSGPRDQSILHHIVSLHPLLVT